MKKFVISLVLLAILLEAKAFGRLEKARPSQGEVQALIPTATPEPQIQNTSAGPVCVIDWSLSYTDDNARAILSCYKARKFSGLNDGPLCAPPDSVWDKHFNSVVCWAINHGTPAALTATAMPPTPTIDWPPTEATPTPPAYP